MDSALFPCVAALSVLAGAQGDASSEAEATSLFARPLFLSEHEPDCRALRVIQIAHVGAASSLTSTRTEPEALALAQQVLDRLARGEAWEALSLELSNARSKESGGVLGTFPPRSLHPGLEDFLWQAALGQVSPPLATSMGVLVAQRIERYAACREVIVLGTSAAALGLANELRVRGDPAKTLADDLVVREGRGRLLPREVRVRVFERGADDAALRRAVFGAAVGERVGPFTSGRGIHVAERVPLELAAPEAFESKWIRARAIFIAHRDAPGAVEYDARSAPEAAALVKSLQRRVEDGADMAALAREFDDDPGGHARDGDLGWLYRGHPGLARAVEPAFLAAPGTLLEPIPLLSGWLLLRRER